MRAIAVLFILSLSLLAVKPIVQAQPTGSIVGRVVPPGGWFYVFAANIPNEACDVYVGPTLVDGYIASNNMFALLVQLPTSFSPGNYTVTLRCQTLSLDLGVLQVKYPSITVSPKNVNVGDYITIQIEYPMESYQTFLLTIDDYVIREFDWGIMSDTYTIMVQVPALKPGTHNVNLYVLPSNYLNVLYMFAFKEVYGEPIIRINHLSRHILVASTPITVNNGVATTDSIAEIKDRLMYLEAQTDLLLAMVTDLSEKYNELNSSVANLTGRVSNLELHVDELDTSLTQLSKLVNLWIEETNTTLRELETRLDSLNATLTTQVRTLEAMVHTLNSTLTLIEETLGDHAARLDALNATVAQLSSSIAWLKASIADLNATMQSQLEEIAVTLQSHARGLEDLQAGIDRLDAALQGLEEKLRGLNESLASDIAELRQRIDTLSKDVENARLNIALLQEKLASLKETTTQSLGALENAVNQLSQDIADLSKRLDQTRQDTDSKLNDVASNLGQQVDSLRNVAYAGTALAALALVLAAINIARQAK